MGPFDYVKSINFKQPIDLSSVETDYLPFIINRAYSNFYDTALQANEMNIRPHATNEQQFKYLNNTISKANRFSEWNKPTKNEDIDLIKQVYKYTTKKAIQVVGLFSEDDLKELRKKVDIGG